MIAPHGRAGETCNGQSPFKDDTLPWVAHELLGSGNIFSEIHPGTLRVMDITCQYLYLHFCEPYART
jgi:hypothetical protein